MGWVVVPLTRGLYFLPPPRRLVPQIPLLVPLTRGLRLLPPPRRLVPHIPLLVPLPRGLCILPPLLEAGARRSISWACLWFCRKHAEVPVECSSAGEKPCTPVFPPGAWEGWGGCPQRVGQGVLGGQRGDAVPSESPSHSWLLNLDLWVVCLSVDSEMPLGWSFRY